MTAAPFTVHTGDCLPELRALAASGFLADSVVCDPPAGIAFMGKAWDRDKGGRDAWIEWMAERAEAALACVPPGGHALVWALPRTSHWTATAWEDAGWEVRDRVSHLFGTGFPKGGDLGKKYAKRGDDPNAEAWAGWQTALKPGMEDWWLFRKPPGGTVLDCVAEHGTGALHVDACRVPTSGDYTSGGAGAWGEAATGFAERIRTQEHPSGRFPANVTHDGSPEVLAAFARFGEKVSGGAGSRRNGMGYHGANGEPSTDGNVGRNEGTAARFFSCLPPDDLRFMYAPKASRAEREAGLDGMEKRVVKITEGHGMGPVNTSKKGDGIRENRPRANPHPTVKPRALMAWLCRLVTPPGGTVLDPFAGSGSTGVACASEGFRFVGIEKEAEYAEIARARVSHAYAEAKAAAPVTTDLSDAPGVAAA